MRYIHTNADGTVAITSCVPKEIIRQEDGAIFTVSGVRKSNGSTVLFGSWQLPVDPDATKEIRQTSGEIVVGDESYDVFDMEADHLEGMTVVFPDFETDIQAKWLPEMKEAVVSHRAMANSEVQTDRTFRDAWRDGGDKIDIDMPTAREITKNRLRAEREPVLVELDVQFMKAMEAGNSQKQAQVATKKQELRDITADPRINAATTPDELKAITLPEIEQE